MDPGTFTERRGMTPSEVAVASLAGWALCFDLPVGPGERGVANLRSDPAATTWGVAYRITVDEGERLDRSEGVPHGVYARRDVTLETRTGRSIVAFTYESVHRAPERKPSPRYIGLLLHGARHHGVPREWIAYLEGLPLAVDERSQS